MRRHLVAYLECTLWVAGCPVGALGADGRFDLPSCYTHNFASS